MTNKNNTILIRVGVNTYHKLDRLRRKKKIKNLENTGRVGNADFDGIITDLLKNNSGGEKNIERNIDKS